MALTAFFFWKVTYVDGLASAQHNPCIDHVCAYAHIRSPSTLHATTSLNAMLAQTSPLTLLAPAYSRDRAQDKILNALCTWCADVHGHRLRRHHTGCTHRGSTLSSWAATKASHLYESASCRKQCALSFHNAICSSPSTIDPGWLVLWCIFILASPLPMNGVDGLFFLESYLR